MTSAKSNVNVKIDAGVKKLATQLFERMGIDQTTAIEMYYRQVIAESRLPFQPTVMPTVYEQIVAAVEAKHIPHVTLDMDEDGGIIINDEVREKHPEIYDWAVNG
jgi:DNA-damage-inducible protein J